MHTVLASILIIMYYYYKTIQTKFYKDLFELNLNNQSIIDDQ